MKDKFKEYAKHKSIQYLNEVLFFFELSQDEYETIKKVIKIITNIKE